MTDETNDVVATDEGTPTPEAEVTEPTSDDAPEEVVAEEAPAEEAPAEESAE